MIANDRTFCDYCGNELDDVRDIVLETCLDCRSRCEGCDRPGYEITWYDGLRICEDCNRDEGEEDESWNIMADDAWS